MTAPVRPTRSAALVALVAAMFALWLVPSAQAGFGFQPGAEGFDAAVTEQDGTPDHLAGTHPYAMGLHIALNQSGVFSEGDLRDLDLALPPGLLANPAALAECSSAQFATPRNSPNEASLSGESCPDASQVGIATVQTSYGGGATRTFGVFNLTPAYGDAETIGLAPFGLPAVLTGQIREPEAALTLSLRNLSQTLNVSSIDLTLWGTPWASTHDGLRGNCLNEVSPAAPYGACHVAEAAAFVHSYLTLPSSCAGGPLRWVASARSWPPGPAASAEAQSRDSEGHPLSLSGCVEPKSIASVKLRTDRAAAPTGLLFDVDINDGGGFLNPGGIVRSPAQKATVALPEGLTLNPSLGAGLGVCSEADFSREAVTTPPGQGCPNASKIGEVEVEGLLGLPGAVGGSVYLAKPFANPAGSLLGLYFTVSDPERGLFAKAAGRLEPDPHTGRLVATFEGLPQIHYTHFTLSLREGQRSALVSPPACGPYVTALDLIPYSNPAETLHEKSTFFINYGEDGGDCPSGGQRPFHPGLQAGSLNPQAGAFTPFLLHMTRTDAEQEITSYSATFPPGFLGKVAGIPLCADAAIEAAKTMSGIAEQKTQSCPAGSQIGRTLAGYGVGGTLAWAPGNLYLAGPYHGSTFSVVAIDSALVGPFDLGTVVVRSAVRVDAPRAQVTLDSAASDPIPHILAGIPIHLRDIRVYVDRPGFTFNPTSCDPLAVGSVLTGSGLDPFAAGDDTAAGSTQRFQVANCGVLGFRPKIALRLKGGPRLGAHPSLRVSVAPRAGDANFRAATVTLPPSLFLAQERFGTVCTLPQSQTNACPVRSIYGHARLLTPLLDQPLEGPVYLRSSSHKLPDLVIGLHGAGIDLDLPGTIDSSHGGIRARFEGLPDAPFSRFELAMRGGKNGILVNSEDACVAPHRAVARFIAQNSATEALRPGLGAKCRWRHRKAHRHRKASVSELSQKGNLRVRFSGSFAPHSLPRAGVAPIAIAMKGAISTVDGSAPPQLERFQIALNRGGRLDDRGLPTCTIRQIQPTTTANALRACGDAKVGEGSFSAAVAVPEQSPFPSQGKLVAFNGTDHGRPVILAHVYGTEPVPTSFTLPLRISRAKGTFGTALSGVLPHVTSKVAVVTGIELRLERSFRYGGKSHSYLSAGCPAPKGFPGAVFSFARASFAFEGGRSVTTTLTRNCRVSG